MTKAPDVWVKGITGEGVVVGGIDTGVRSTHEILRGNFRSSYGWFDATYECPTDPSGKNPDCSKALHIVNNSWGASGGDTSYDAALKAWSAAGIIPIFSGGNSGFGGCNDVDAPGDSPMAISVGATTNTDKHAEFSSKGPSKAGLVKPDLSAPGVNVLSANYKSDTDYKAIDWTSHSAPHVAGVVALMLSANKSLNFNQVRSILTTTTEQSLKPSGFTCGRTVDTKYPNNQYGYGRVNALKAVLKATSTTQ